MISWHTVPKWEYLGYSYAPYVDEYDDGVRKAYHYIMKGGVQCGEIDHTPYKFLTEDEFTYHIDMMFFDPYEYSEKQGAIK